MTGDPINISVLTPFDQAIARVKQMLFQPFDLGKWFVIGFCAWLAELLNGGGANFTGPIGGNNNNNFNGFQDALNQAKDFLNANWAWLVPVGIAAFVALIALWLVLLWLSSRGEFMFLHCVARNKAEIVEPWRLYSAQANSLFRFRALMVLLFLLLAGAPIAALAVTLYKTINFNNPSMGGIIAICGAALILAAASFALFLIAKFTKDFVAPIMYLRGSTCAKAWGEFLPLLGGHPGSFILYLLFQIVLAVLSLLAIFVLFAVTCCIACCITALPYLGTVLLLPIFMFRRSYSLFYLRQFGTQYDVFISQTQAPAAV